MPTCITCGATFEARSHAKYCSERCRGRARRLRAAYPAKPSAHVEPEFGVGISDAEEALARAAELAEDMSRLACRLPEPYAGALDRTARAIMDALGDWGTR